VEHGQGAVPAVGAQLEHGGHGDGGVGQGAGEDLGREGRGGRYGGARRRRNKKTPGIETARNKSPPRPSPFPHLALFDTDRHEKLGGRLVGVGGGENAFQVTRRRVRDDVRQQAAFAPVLGRAKAAYQDLKLSWWDGRGWESVRGAVDARLGRCRATARPAAPARAACARIAPHIVILLGSQTPRAKCTSWRAK